MKVSVITTLYNYREYIEDCIKSFLNQDFKDSEIIVVDDCSTDNPLDAIEKYLGERVRYIRLPEKANYSIAKNVGIQNSKSEVLVMLDADDMLTRKGISIRYKKLMEGFDFVHGPCWILYENGSKIRGTVWQKYLRTRDPRDIHAQTVMLRKDIHRKIGLYDESLWNSSDREMWIRIHNYNYKVGIVNEEVSVYRIHPKQMHASKKKMASLSEFLALVEEKSKKRRVDLFDVRML